MINRILSSMLIATFILAAGLIAGPAQSNALAGGNTPAAASSTTNFEGLLVVKEADGVFLVRSENGDKRRFTMNPDVKITRNGIPAAYTDLRSRDRIRVHYTPKSGITKIEAGGP